MSFGQSMFPAGYNQKTAKEDLFVRGNHGIPQHYLRSVTPGFIKKTKPGLSYVCPGSPHICQNEKISETMLLYNVNIAILNTYIRVSRNND
jgi:hypothetical protein